MATIDDSSAHGDGNVRLPDIEVESKLPIVHTELKAGALNLPEVLMQSVTTIAPAIAALFFTPFVVSLAGVASPLAYPIGFVITLLLGIVLVQFTKKMPAAGGYYTYISRSLHPVSVGWSLALALHPVRAHCRRNCVVIFGQHPTTGTAGQLGASIGPGFQRYS